MKLDGAVNNLGKIMIAVGLTSMVMTLIVTSITTIDVGEYRYEGYTKMAIAEALDITSDHHKDADIIPISTDEVVLSYDFTDKDPRYHGLVGKEVGFWNREETHWTMIPMFGGLGLAFIGIVGVVFWEPNRRRRKTSS